MFHGMGFHRITYFFALVSAVFTAHGTHAQLPTNAYTYNAITLITADVPDPVERNALDLFTRRMAERTRVSIHEILVSQFNTESAGTSLKNTLPVFVGIVGHHARLDRTLAASAWTVPATAEGYMLHSGDEPTAIQSESNQDSRELVVWLGGRDARGVLCGLGKLLREMQCGPDSVSVRPFHLETAPHIADRGVYFATHFYNYYEGASEAELDRTVEELALWGFNTIWTWFDMNWYPEGFWNDPQSRGMHMLERIRRINRIAQSLGVRVGLGGISNEGFQRQPPPELRADPSDQRGGFYPDSQICPSKPGGLEMILHNRRKVLELIGPIQVYWNWPYDQGGCGCRECRPWTKTFLKFAPDIANVVRELNPDAAFILSTWLLHPDERAWVYELANAQPSWLNGLVMATDTVGETALPDSCMKLAFPEISMFDCYFISYGSNGANPAPRRFIAQARRIAEAGYGTALYSEGLYDDINKIVWACVLWDPERTAEDILSEYCRYYFGEDNRAATVEAILGLEETWGAAKLRNADLARVESLHRQIESLHALPFADPAARERSGLLYYRSLLDCRMKRIGPDLPLRERALDLYTQLTGPDVSHDWKHAAESLLPAVEARLEATQGLYQSYWDYLSTFHLRRTILIFRPDEAIGSTDFTRLAEALRAALDAPDPEAGRQALRRGMFAWQWYDAMQRSGTRKELYRPTRLFFEDVAFLSDSARVRAALTEFRGPLESALQHTQASLEAAWERAAPQLPVVSEIQAEDRSDYTILLNAVREAESLQDDEAMRDALYQAFHRWFWFNNVPLDFLFF